VVAPTTLLPPLSRAEAAGQGGAQAENDRFKLQNDVRGTLLQGLGGAVLLLGAAFTWLQLRATREGQITDRYTKAVDQLGSNELAVRVGGVYALQRIARDSRSDRATIAEVLCAYARSVKREPRTEHDPESHTFEKRAPHVQAALTVLAHWWRRVGGEPEWQDLHGADFQDARLERAHLSNAYFYDAQLQRAKLNNAILVKANFVRAQLQDADLRGANLAEANLYKAKLAGAKADEGTTWPDYWKDPTVRREAGIVHVEQ
jgi:Pentapeptide repeats (8 copies)